ncbi:hypothetical protein Molly5_21 [Maribacter phage Molly_5]|uniref:Uncharacterized protein n=1 Tax=Maribacter phage Molly_1 TaxID=2745685 RepID=A0A8E4XVE8_9CAUD|nr:hypothetical protein M1M29_gp021 [Maribacter phage Molly_1]QQO97702.1 hypothetical protein Molly2_21 [Maribacter phage Molly_2]QQO97902.1 hypothetical protein Molly3_21 [Maribacter phage Molly_3]QQO98102.1 hypothetical protein Molly4_21 [Maribacter phage Molly_4]QQO98302.1 hypothetical protein Molly5_21 [Maribacter phage Molly_5]QQO97502.1 hypothetical protein Molly1_21 [Maribacter phage Molly_1]
MKPKFVFSLLILLVVAVIGLFTLLEFSGKNTSFTPTTSPPVDPTVPEVIFEHPAVLDSIHLDEDLNP